MNKRIICLVLMSINISIFAQIEKDSTIKIKFENFEYDKKSWIRVFASDSLKPNDFSQNILKVLG